MSLRKLLGASALGVGGLLAANYRLRDDDLQPALSGRHETIGWRGLEVAVTEAGNPDNPTLVLFHGMNAAGSSGEFRAVVDDLADRFHVVAPDFPGFGCSARPPLRYSATLSESFVGEFLQRDDSPCVVASSLSAAYTLGALTGENGADASGLLLICPTSTAGPTPPKTWLRELIRLPVIGEGLFNLITSRPSIRYFNADHGYYDSDKAGEDWEAYEWQTAHQPNARFAPASFISGFLNSDVDLAEAIRAADLPTTLLWGRETALTPLADGRDLAEESGAALVVFDEAKLLPHVEFPDQFCEVVTDRLAPSVKAASEQ